MNYGVPYKGSKNKIAEELAQAIPHPHGSHFYDLFAGGCAVTHALMQQNAFRHYHINDIDGKAVRLFFDAANGKYADEKRWISREEFSKLKDTDPYVAVCWSFGNNMRNYMYAREIESWKKALHWARVYGDTSLLEEYGIKTDGSRADMAKHMNEYKKAYIKWWLDQQGYSSEELDALIAKCKGDIAVQEEELRQYLLEGLKSSGLTQAEVSKRLGTQMTGHYFGRSQWEFPTQEYYEQMQTFMPALNKDYNEVVGLHNLWQRLQSLQSQQSLESLQSLQSLERLQRLQSLESLQSLERLEEPTFLSYEKVQIEPNSIVYCDIPYKGTDGYGDEKDSFDHAAFYDWCERQTNLTLISEYSMPEDRFTCVWAKEKVRNLCAASRRTKAMEKLYVPNSQVETYKQSIHRLFI